MRKEIVFILFSIILATGCSVSRRGNIRTDGAESAPGTSSTIASVLANNLTNTDFFIQRADIRLTQENITVHFIAAIRFKRPDSLIISVKSRAGIEAGRAFMTRDTVIISDRINKKLLVGDAKSIKSKYGIESSYIYAVLGDLIIKQKEELKTLNCNKGNSLAKIESQGSKIEYTIDCKRKKAVKTYFEGELRSANIEVGFSDFIRVDRIEIPRKIEISEDKNNLNLGIEIKKIEIPWKGSFKFIAGNGYKIVRIR